jgi:molecular chaperone GrpE (heat shock protein)
MGSNLAFDTHEFVENLTKAKMSKQQAEVLAKHYANLLTDRLATKDDISLLKQDILLLKQDLEHLKQDLKNLREESKQDLKHLEDRLSNKITITVLASQVATIAIISGVIALFN